MNPFRRVLSDDQHLLVFIIIENLPKTTDKIDIEQVGLGVQDNASFHKNFRLCGSVMVGLGVWVSVSFQ